MSILTVLFLRKYFWVKKVSSKITKNHDAYLISFFDLCPALVLLTSDRIGCRMAHLQYFDNHPWFNRLGEDSCRNWPSKNRQIGKISEKYDIDWELIYYDIFIFFSFREGFCCCYFVVVIWVLFWRIFLLASFVFWQENNV